MGVAQMYLDPATIHDDPSYPERFVERVMVRGQDWLTHIQFDMLPFHDRGRRIGANLFSELEATVGGDKCNVIAGNATGNKRCARQASSSTAA